MKRHCLSYRRQKGGSTPRTLIPVWTLPLRHISSSLCVARPFTNGVEWGWKKCTDPMVGGARSITLYDACTPSSGPDGNKRPRGTPTFLTPVRPNSASSIHELARQGKLLRSQKPDGHAHTKNAITLRACTTSSGWVELKRPKSAIFPNATCTYDDHFHLGSLARLEGEAVCLSRCSSEKSETGVSV